MTTLLPNTGYSAPLAEDPFEGTTYRLLSSLAADASGQTSVGGLGSQ